MSTRTTRCGYRSIRHPSSGIILSVSVCSSKIMSYSFQTSQSNPFYTHHMFHFHFAKKALSLKFLTVTFFYTGVLFDMYNVGDDSTLPWCLTVHFTKFPDDVIFRCPNRDTVEAHFMASLKEADVLKHRGTVMQNMQKKDHTQLWLGLVNGDITFVRISKDISLQTMFFFRQIWPILGCQSSFDGTRIWSRRRFQTHSNPVLQWGKFNFLKQHLFRLKMKFTRI